MPWRRTGTSAAVSSGCLHVRTCQVHGPVGIQRIAQLLSALTGVDPHSNRAERPGIAITIIAKEVEVWVRRSGGAGSRSRNQVPSADLRGPVPSMVLPEYCEVGRRKRKPGPTGRQYDGQGLLAACSSRRGTRDSAALQRRRPATGASPSARSPCPPARHPPGSPSRQSPRITLVCPPAISRTTIPYACCRDRAEAQLRPLPHQVQ